MSLIVVKLVTGETVIGEYANSTEEDDDAGLWLRQPRIMAMHPHPVQRNQVVVAMLPYIMGCTLQNNMVWFSTEHIIVHVFESNIDAALVHEYKKTVLGIDIV